MNFRYWKQRAEAEMDTNAVMARQLFYEGTKAYKTGDFPVAAANFKEGLRIWKILMEDYPTYRDDELSKKDTGQIVKRYVRVLTQNLTPIPDDLPFKDYLKLVQSDNTVDPFDALEMIGPLNTQEPAKTPSPGPNSRSRAHGAGGNWGGACGGRKGQEQGKGRRKGESQGGGCETEHACSERAERLRGRQALTPALSRREREQFGAAGGPRGGPSPPALSRREREQFAVCGLVLPVAAWWCARRRIRRQALTLRLRPRRSGV